MCTPWDLDSIKILESFNVPAYKVASADLTNLPLVESLVATEKTPDPIYGYEFNRRN